MTADQAVLGARASKIWYGPVLYRRDSEPYMTIAVAGSHRLALDPLGNYVLSIG